ncbi:fimbria/pilus periplasmic chaperone [Morganella sp. Je.2.23]|uniref:fimbrial biogenesis chaperone n=1 Tax=Morganella sp. Je.2.23 TaxID=3142840 RepID=UPI003DA9B301
MFFNSVKTLLISCLFSGFAYSAVVVEGTRVIFDGGKKEQVVRINNKDETVPALIQVWVDDGVDINNINNPKIPFVVTPPITRIEPGKGQSIRLVYNGMTLPQDKESAFYFNVLEIPQETAEAKNAAQRLDIAFKTRIKLFYRPESLRKLSASDEAGNVKWSVVNIPGKGTGLKAENPSPLYISVAAVNTKMNGKLVTLDGDMIPPMSSAVYTQTEKSQKLSGTISEFTFVILNEFGGQVETKFVKSGTGFAVAK